MDPSERTSDPSSASHAHDPSPVTHGSPLDPMERRRIVRLLDANANRVGEGLRVLEDHARFVLDDGVGVAAIKALRHALVGALGVVSVAERIGARDTNGDVGTDAVGSAEFDRAGLDSVVTANWKRVQQAMRSIEEFLKLIDAESAVRIERLRYDSYTLEARTTRSESRLARLARASLYLLADGGGSAADFERRVLGLLACEATVDVIQLRDKQLDDRQLLDRARRLRSLTRGHPVLVMVNDRADIAVASDADGVHVGQTELPVRDARRVIGPGALVGVSTHDVAQLRRAIDDGADYVGCGPVFPSETKTFDSFGGTEYLIAAAPIATLPAFAIGGIREEAIGRVRSAGFTRVAVRDAVWNAPDPAAALRRIRAALVANTDRAPR